MKISIVYAGPENNECDLDSIIAHTRRIFSDSEVILSTTSASLFTHYKNTRIFDKVIITEDPGCLPSLKFSNEQAKNNINRQIVSSLSGISAASNDIVLKLRTDQTLLDNKIIDIWAISEKTIKNRINSKKGRIITSSCFSLNPRYQERMLYHISDMIQFGYKTDLIDYYNCDLYDFMDATWYERNEHSPKSTSLERDFRSRLAVEQWLCLNYIFKNKAKPISFHNDITQQTLKEYESIWSDYFFIASPAELSLRSTKFDKDRFYYETQCYTLYHTLSLINRNQYNNRNEYIQSILEKTEKNIVSESMINLINIYSKTPFVNIIRLLPSNLKTVLKRYILRCKKDML